MSNAIDPIRRGWTSASNSLADSLCPGRHIAQRGIVEPSKGEDAQSGSRIHAALAVSADSEMALRGLSVTEREVFQACRSIEKKVVAQFFGPDVSPVVFRHRRYWVKIQKADKSVVEHSGEADVIWRVGTKILIADYKTLVGEIPDSPQNLQLRDLAVLARGELQPIAEVGTVIIQPLVTHSPEVCLYTAPDLDRAQHEMFVRVINSNDPQSQRQAGEAQCAFCLAKPNCVQYQKWAGQITPPQMLSVLEVPMVAWTAEQRAIAANALGPAQDFLDQLKDYLKAGLQKDGSFCPGWTLKPGVKRESINDPQECFKRFNALGGTLEQFMATISVGKTKLKEALAGVTGANGMALDKAVKTLTDGIVETSVSAPSLKKVDGK